MKRRPIADPAEVPDDVEIEIADVGGERLAILTWPVKRISTLSPTEEAVLRGIALGHSNARIAKDRGTSPRTVANQVASLLRKLGVSSRYELVAAMSGRSS